MNNKAGFTLIELLAVIVIIAVIMLIGVTAVGPIMEKSKKSSLADEGVELVKSSKTAYFEDTNGLTGKNYSNKDAVCYSMEYLKNKGLFEKGEAENYTGSVLVTSSGNDKYDYHFWIGNGTYAITNADLQNYSDIKNPNRVIVSNQASNDCGKTLPNGNEEIKKETQKIYDDANLVFYTYCALNDCSRKIVETITISNNSNLVETSDDDIPDISFTINSIAYTTKLGTTWNTWFNEVYKSNTISSISYIKSYSNYISGSTSSGQFGNGNCQYKVNPSSAIKANHKYSFKREFSPGSQLRISLSTTAMYLYDLEDCVNGVYYRDSVTKEWVKLPQNGNTVTFPSVDNHGKEVQTWKQYIEMYDLTYNRTPGSTTTISESSTCTPIYK